jgi:hypothetical protein
MFGCHYLTKPNHHKDVSNKFQVSIAVQYIVAMVQLSGFRIQEHKIKISIAG